MLSIQFITYRENVHTQFLRTKRDLFMQEIAFDVISIAYLIRKSLHLRMFYVKKISHGRLEQK